MGQEVLPSLVHSLAGNPEVVVGNTTRHGTRELCVCRGAHLLQEYKIGGSSSPEEMVASCALADFSPVFSALSRRRRLTMCTAAALSIFSN